MEFKFRKSPEEEQKAYHEDLKKFFEKFLYQEDFPIILFKSKLIFYSVARILVQMLEIGSDEDEALREIYKMEINFFTSVLKSFDTLNEGIAKKMKDYQ